MRKAIVRTAGLFVITAATLTACKKEDVVPNRPPADPIGTYAVKVRAAITVGDVVYDSIPASFTLTSWDKAGVQHQQRMNLPAGTNTVYLPKAHTKYSIRLDKWGVTDERTILSGQVDEATTYTLGGRKAAKKLTQEVGYVLEAGNYQLNYKRTYAYDAQGRLKEIQNYYRDPLQGTPQLVLSSTDHLSYNGSRLEDVQTTMADNQVVRTMGVNRFSYNEQGKVVHIQYGVPGSLSSLRIGHVQEGPYEVARGEYYDMNNSFNGTRTDIRFAGGNKVEEKVMMPNNQTSVRTWSYDGNINPFVHMKFPRFDLSGLSKNNAVEEHLDYLGVYVKNQYTYNADGYISEVVKKEIDDSGKPRLILKTVYTY